MESTTNIETIEYKLTEVCRICLLKMDDMMNIKQKNEQSDRLISMLSTLGNFEVVLNDVLPTSICKECEEKLEFSYNFQQTVQKSNEMFKQFLVEPTAIDDIEVVENSKMDTSQRTNRLKQFPMEVVQEALDKLKEDFKTNSICIKCNFVCANNRSLIVHMTHRHKEIRNLWCSICNLEVDNLTVHNTESHSKELECQFCHKIVTKRSYLIEHLLGHMSERPFKCDSCDKSFTSSSHLSKHKRFIHNEQSYQCGECTEKFWQKPDLILHLKDSHNIQKIEDNMLLEPKDYCPRCKKKVPNLEDHNSKFHCKNLDKLLCTICGKLFKNTSKLNIHMRIHTGETPYKCSFCDKRMKSQNHLIVHERIHTGEKPHICNYCGKSFRQSSVLNTHMRIHTGRTEKCDICSKEFCRPVQLRLHLRKHTGETPYLCTNCGREFKQKSHLTEHLKTHSDERPYKCSYCNKGFKNSSTLRIHVQIHLGYKRFKCSQCPFATRYGYHLTQHMKQHEEDAPNPENPHKCDMCLKGFNTMAMLSSHNCVGMS